MGHKTTSLWGRPPSRYYALLRRAESSRLAGRLHLAVLGCSDGKFVLPAARRGFTVLAVDVDEIALFGGTKIGPDGPIHMPGLRARLESEGLSHQVEIVYGDLVEYEPTRPSDVVLTSGALQYSRNMKHPMDEMVGRLQSHVDINGLIYVDYMLPMEDRYRGRDNYPDRRQWARYFAGNEWRMIHHRVLPPQFEAAHVDLPVDHEHHWGHLMAQRVSNGK